MKGKLIVGVPRHIYYSLRVHVHLGTYNVCVYVCDTLIEQEDLGQTPCVVLALVKEFHNKSYMHDL